MKISVVYDLNQPSFFKLNFIDFPELSSVE